LGLNSAHCSAAAALFETNSPLRALNHHRRIVHGPISICPEVKMNRKTLLAFVVVVLSLATAPSRAVQTTSKPALANAPVSIPFELVARHIVLQVRINDSR